MKNVGNYNDDYGFTDVKKKDFTVNMHRKFKLDLPLFETLAWLSWEAAVKTTRINLELVADVSMILF